MNKGRKIKHSLMKNEENETTSTSTTKPTKLLTPCRRVGLNRKRKNILSGSCSSSELNISSPNTSLTEIDISVKEHDATTPSVIDKIKVDTTPPVLQKPAKHRKNKLGTSRKRSQTTPIKNEPTILSPEELTKKNTTELPEDISSQIENEAISSTPELVETNTENTEIQTNQISTTIEEDSAPPVVVPQTQDAEKSPNKSAAHSKKIKDLFGDSDDSDFEFKHLDTTETQKQKLKSGENRKKKKTNKREESIKKNDSQNDSDEITELNAIPRKKRKRSSSSHNKKSPKTNKLSTKARLYNSDSDDDFMEKPRREKKDPDIKKKINIPAPDPLNRIEHIRIRENKSYTIMHMNNISSYVKYYDNDVNLKRTESDDNQQTNSQPVVSNVRTSMILERKDYLSNKGSQESNRSKSSDNVENPEVCVENETENPDETENHDSNDTESPDSNDTLPEIRNYDTTNAEKAKTVRYYERPDFDIPDDFETTDNRSFDTTGISRYETPKNSVFGPINNSNFETTENPVFETTTNSNFETTENPVFDTTTNSNFETTVNPVFETTNNSNFETTNNGSFETTDNRNFETTNDRTFEIPNQSHVDNDFDKLENSDGEKLDDTKIEMRKLLKLKSNLINEIKMKRDKLDSLKRIMAYKEEHNLDDLTKTTLQFKYTLQEALVDLLSHLKTHTERNFNMLLLLGFLKIPSEMVGYNDETKSFE